jgi:hypothetical protein
MYKVVELFPNAAKAEISQGFSSNNNNIWQKGLQQLQHFLENRHRKKISADTASVRCKVEVLR